MPDLTGNRRLNCVGAGGSRARQTTFAGSVLDCVRRPSRAFCRPLRPSFSRLRRVLLAADASRLTSTSILTHRAIDASPGSKDPRTRWAGKRLDLESAHKRCHWAHGSAPRHYRLRLSLLGAESPPRGSGVRSPPPGRRPPGTQQPARREVSIELAVRSEDLH